MKDDPTNNVPDSIFSKLGFHRRNNAMFSCFDAKNYAKFDNLCPLVSVKAVGCFLNYRFQFFISVLSACLYTSMNHIMSFFAFDAG